MLFLFALQAVATLPDIELKARVQARQVTIEKRGEARLTVSAAPDAGSVVDVRAPRANGRKTLRNVDVTVAAEARIGDPTAPSQRPSPPAATSAPQ